METKQQIRSFLCGQALADGLRITVEIIMPSLVFALLGKIETGMIISLGALCVSISDGPGPVVHKKNGMLYATLLVFVMTMIRYHCFLS